MALRRKCSISGGRNACSPRSLRGGNYGCARDATRSPLAEKARGAFFTPPAIAEYLTRWAIKDPSAKVLDPTCGEAVFLLAAGERLRKLGAEPEAIREQLSGVDLHKPSLDASGRLLAEQGLGANLVERDFFDLETPAQFGDRVGWMDAVIGNPPFASSSTAALRKRSASAALAQGVRLSGLASSWAATLVHASAFLKPNGRLAMVLPAAYRAGGAKRGESAA